VDVGRARPGPFLVVGRTFSSTQGISPPNPEGRSQKAEVRLPEVGCGMGRGGPQWLALQHREVDVGRVRSGPILVVGRTFSSAQGISPPLRQAVGSSPPEKYERALESIVRSRTRSNRSLPRAGLKARETLGRCKATLFCMRNAVHEFPRNRCLGKSSMLSFRSSETPQLLLMPQSLRNRNGVENRCVFMMQYVHYCSGLQFRGALTRGEPRSGSPPG